MLFTTETPKKPLLPRKAIAQLQNTLTGTKEGAEKDALQTQVTEAISARVEAVKAQYEVTTSPLRIECVECGRSYSAQNKITDSNRKQWGYVHQRKCSKFYEKDLAADTEEFINHLLTNPA